MIGAKLSSWTLLFNLLKIAASKKKVRENVTSAPTSQMGQRRQANWHGYVIPPLWVDVIKGDTPFCALTSLQGIPHMWDAVI